MALIEKSDLSYTDYTWTTYAKDDPKVTGVPDSTLLNRKEGYEVLYFINKLAEILNFKQKSSGVKIEKMIREQVPENIRSQQGIQNWIKTNWNM